MQLRDFGVKKAEGEVEDNNGICRVQVEGATKAPNVLGDGGGLLQQLLERRDKGRQRHSEEEADRAFWRAVRSQEALRRRARYEELRSLSTELPDAPVGGGHCVHVEVCELGERQQLAVVQESSERRL